MAEYLSRAMAFAQDAAKLSLRFSEGIVENALEFGLDTPGSFFDNAEYKLIQVRKELSSASDKEKLVAMKKLLATIAKGRDASEYFADVVKNVASGNLELRRLVYIYLLRYAEQEQDLALLSINTFQRDLADSNQVIRAMALRVMSSIRVPVISPIVMLAIRKCAADRSPHVRKTAALAVPKLLRLDPALREELVGVVSNMLNESSPLAVGSVIQAFQAVCPTQYSLVHMQFRRWCLMLSELDEWGQVELVKLLAAYARTQFLCPANIDTAASKEAQERDFYASDAEEDLVSAGGANGKLGGKLDPDHELLLKSIHPLLQSRNSAVVLTVVSAYYHLAPTDQLGAVSKPLVRLMKASRETGYVALTNIIQVVGRTPAIFYPHARSFFIAASDPPFTRKLKLQVMAEIASPETANTLIPELASYARSTRVDVSTGAVGVILACAQKVKEVSMDCFQSLLMLLEDTRADVASQAMHAIRVLLLDGTIRDSQDRRRTATLYDILCYLVRTLDKCKADMARACVFSLVSEFLASKFGTLHALDVLRGAVRAFKDEGNQAKMQILELSARMVLLRKTAVSVDDEAKKSLENTGDPDSKKDAEKDAEFLNDLHTYLFTLARYDVSFEVRDRARVLRALCPLGGDEDHSVEMPCVLDMASELMGGEVQTSAIDTINKSDVKDARISAIIAAAQPAYTIASLSLTLDRPVRGYLPLPDWPTEKPKDANRGPKPGTSSSRTLGAGGRGGIEVGGSSTSRAINIAGISGTAQPYYSGAEYSTPRSAADGNDDLDAFLNSDNDSANAQRLHAPRFTHSPMREQRTAMVFKQ
ncbi:AP-3 complex subunit beta, partial [Dipsacomyces acuminosporus]